MVATTLSVAHRCKRRYLSRRVVHGLQILGEDAHLLRPVRSAGWQPRRPLRHQCTHQCNAERIAIRGSAVLRTRLPCGEPMQVRPRVIYQRSGVAASRAQRLHALADPVIHVRP